MTQSRKSSDTGKPNELASRVKSSNGMSGNMHDSLLSALPMYPGSPVERAKEPWEVGAVSAMWVRCLRVAGNADVQLGWALRDG